MCSPVGDIGNWPWIFTPPPTLLPTKMIMKSVLTTVLSLLFVAVTIVPSSIVAQEAKVKFARDIRPILSDKCFKCHGPDEATREADLRLDIREDAEYVIADGTESDLISRIVSDDPDLLMPPPESKMSLSKSEIDLLKRWVAEGAKYEKHWSFQRIEKPILPTDSDSNWVINEIDRFIERKLKQNSLKPSNKATKEQLIRRITFDLTGLPPTIAEIDAFLADESNEAIEKLIDGLMKRPAYGERMASEWLDVARYADSYGYQVDRDRYVWPWRDWVVRSFNSNMPYDQFVTEQVAGDLLPNATDDQILATTFNRLHSQKVEGGSVPEEFRVEYVADRTHTFATAFLGLTFECCRCHDHKYDPFSQKEYYELFSFFNNIDEFGLYSYFTSSIPTPTLRITSEDQKKKVTAAVENIAKLETELKKELESSKTRFDKWLNQRPLEDKAKPFIKHLSFEDHKGGANASVKGKVGKAIKLSGDDGYGVGVGNFTRYQPFSIGCYINCPDERERAVVYHRSRAWTDAGSRGYQLLIEEGKLSFSLIHFWPGNAIRVKTVDKIKPGQWQHVTVTYDGGSKASSIKLFMDGKPVKTEVVRDNLYKNITGGGGDNIVIGERFRDNGFSKGMVDEFKVFDRQISELEAYSLVDPQQLLSLLKATTNSLDESDRKLLFEYFALNFDDGLKKKSESLKAARKSLADLQNGMTEIMVMSELEKPRDAYVLARGAYDARTEKVSMATPRVLPPFPKGAAKNRLGLARWLTSRDHPLLARVTVNRYWQMIFGEGLVETSEDFGSQGSAPSHSELLDWLAADFIEHNWDLQRLLKQMLMSATYQQDSRVNKNLLEVDPENRLLARASAYRLPAEMIRDNALSLSDLLVKKVGGAPARPYEVTVSFKPVGRHRGEGLYRRSIYTYWRRTGPAPVMMALDSSKREVCTVKRERTSTPIQAFVLLNDPQIVEACKHIAQNLIVKHGDKDAAIINELFRMLTSRKPLENETRIVKLTLDEQLAHYKANVEAAKRLLKVGDKQVDAKLEPARLAALTSTVNMLMNFDNSVMKR